MATRTWRGYAVAVAEVQTLTPVNPQEDVIFTATINGKDVTYTVTVADMASGTGDEASAVAAAVDGLVTAWNNSTIPEFAEITASDGTTALILTHDTAGTPFTVSGAAALGVSAQNERHSVTITGTPTGGTFTLTYVGQTTAGIAYNASAATVDSALEALSNIGAGDVTCSGGPLPGTSVTVEFTGALAQTNVATMTADGAALTGGTSPAVSITIPFPGSAGLPTFGNATTTTGTGPNFFDNADNWTGGAVPVDADDIVFENSDVDCLYAIDQNGVTPTTITVKQSYTGKIGLPRKNAAGYIEYRDTYLKMQDSGDATTTTVEIGAGSGTGSGRIKLDSNTGQTVLNILSSGSSAETGVPAIVWKGTHASNVANITKGDVGIAFFDGESATVATLRSAYATSVQSDVTLVCGPGTTLTTIDMAGGTVTIDSGSTTVNLIDGDLSYLSGNITTLNIDAGSFFCESDGTITTLNLGSGGNFDCRRNLKSRTVTNANLYEGFELHDPFGTVTWINGLGFHRTSPSKGTFDVKEHRTWTPSSI